MACVFMSVLCVWVRNMRNCVTCVYTRMWVVQRSACVVHFLGLSCLLFKKNFFIGEYLPKLCPLIMFYFEEFFYNFFLFFFIAFQQSFKFDWPLTLWGKKHKIWRMNSEQMYFHYSQYILEYGVENILLSLLYLLYLEVSILFFHYIFSFFIHSLYKKV